MPRPFTRRPATAVLQVLTGQVTLVTALPVRPTSEATELPSLPVGRFALATTVANPRPESQPRPLPARSHRRRAVRALPRKTATRRGTAGDVRRRAPRSERQRSAWMIGEPTALTRDRSFRGRKNGATPLTVVGAGDEEPSASAHLTAPTSAGGDRHTPVDEVDGALLLSSGSPGPRVPTV